jgi:GNAT superfamily N-acetyltransferase
MIDVRVLTGAALDAALDDVARLRITVFREWPYLYDGDLEYERDYLNAYRKSSDAVLIGAFDGTELIGAATGTPMLEHADEFASAFQGLNWDLSQVFYCAESVLLNTYRGSGIGHRFFDLREEHARALGCSKVAFCAVLRPVDHPSAPH